ncbi:MAG: hypothetical protein P4L99_27800 [Chthoniobacter sp.]|nr:hypothetical protein [Chthoniobacter sp.]
MATEISPSRLRWRWLAWVLALVVVSGGVWKGVAGYRVWRLQNFLTAGRSALQRGDYRAAEAWTRRALQVAPQNGSVVRLGAELEEAQDLPDAALWWARVVQLEPGNTEALFSWAKTALRNGQRETAERALQLASPAARQSASYCELMAGVALGAKRPDSANAYFSEAARLEPQNPVHRMNLASLRLGAQDAATAAAARLELEASAESAPATRLLALRALLGDAVRRQDAERQRTLREQLLAMPDRSWNDGILCLSAAQDAAAFRSELGPLEVRAPADSRQIVALADWLTAHGHGDETKRWLTSLPDPRRAEVRVQICLANAFTVTADWKALRQFLGTGNWQQIDFLRRATLVRTTKEIGEPYEKDWRELIASVTDQPEALLMLGQTAQAWGWTEQAENTYWQAAGKQIAVRQGALRSLWVLYSATQNTPGLLRVARQQYGDNPDDPLAKNNYAFLSLLLHANPTAAARLAREVGTTAGAPPAIRCHPSLRAAPRGSAGRSARAAATPARAGPAAARPRALLCAGPGRYGGNARRPHNSPPSPPTARRCSRKRNACSKPCKRSSRSNSRCQIRPQALEKPAAWVESAFRLSNPVTHRSRVPQSAQTYTFSNKKGRVSPHPGSRRLPKR